ncbi:MAG TPA: hypothetical protein VEB21_07175, partial [Terriglobales bacterium]|nr:hypothetical protein [Terriglobales bacterium]
MRSAPVFLLMLLLTLFGCSRSSQLPITATIGPNPHLEPPEDSLLPIMEVAPANRWPAGTNPIPAEGLAVNLFSAGLDHPRWLYVLPNGDVLVAETNAPPRPKEAKSIKGMLMQAVMKVTGSKT